MTSKKNSRIGTGGIFICTNLTSGKCFHLLQHDMFCQVKHHRDKLGPPRGQEQRRQHFRGRSAVLILAGRGGKSQRDNMLHNEPSVSSLLSHEYILNSVLTMMSLSQASVIFLNSVSALRSNTGQQYLHNRQPLFELNMDKRLNT